MADVLAQEQEKARERVRQNLRKVVARRHRGVYGLANDTTVRAALELATEDGTVSVIEHGKKIRDAVIGRGHHGR